MSKKVLVVSSSFRRHGNSDLLCDEFVRGAQEAGNAVEKIFLKDYKINFCLGCGVCNSTHKCVQKDDMEKLRNLILSSDMMVLATPLYYFGFSSQLKLVIDRWYSFTTALSAKHMKTALIVAAWDSNDWTMEDIAHHYRTLCRYMNFQDMGMILGKGCGSG